MDVTFICCCVSNVAVFFLDERARHSQELAEHLKRAGIAVRSYSAFWNDLRNGDILKELIATKATTGGLWIDPGSTAWAVNLFATDNGIKLLENPKATSRQTEGDQIQRRGQRLPRRTRSRRRCENKVDLLVQATGFRCFAGGELCCG